MEFVSLNGVEPLLFDEEEDDDDDDEDEDEDDNNEFGVREVNCCCTTAAAIARVWYGFECNNEVKWWLFSLIGDVEFELSCCCWFCGCWFCCCWCCCKWL